MALTQCRLQSQIRFFCCLFIFYYAYKVGTDKSRSIFNSNTVGALKFLPRVLYIVDNEGWTNARLFWLIENNLIKKKSKDARYDIENTVDEILFRFIKPIQIYPHKSKCACSVCPALVREHMSTEFGLI